MEQKERLIIELKRDVNVEGRVVINFTQGRVEVCAGNCWEENRLKNILLPFCRAGHVAELQGEHFFSSETTWIWPSSEKMFSVSENCRLAIPEKTLIPEEMVGLLERTGAGGVILGTRPGSVPSASSERAMDLSVWSQTLKEKEFRVGFRPSFLIKGSTCPFDKDYRQSVSDGLEQFFSQVNSDLIIWESRYLEERYRKGAEDALLIDLLVEELSLIENFASNLLFFLPEDSNQERQAKLTLALAEFSGKTTKIGCLGAEHVVWGKLRERLAPVGLPIMGMTSPDLEGTSPLMQGCLKDQVKGVILALDENEDDSKEKNVWIYSAAVALRQGLESLNRTWQAQT